MQITTLDSGFPRRGDQKSRGNQLSQCFTQGITSINVICVISIQYAIYYY